VADEVGLGKTIETGMVVRKLMARREAQRVLVVCPAGHTKNWRDELNDCFRLHFEILGLGHPLVDAVLAHLKKPAWKGDVADLGSSGNVGMLSVRWLVSAEMDNGRNRHCYVYTQVDRANGLREVAERADLEALLNLAAGWHADRRTPIAIEQPKMLAEASLNDWLSRRRAELDGLGGFRVELVGLSFA
jgi:hypothetical protein